MKRPPIPPPSKAAKPHTPPPTMSVTTSSGMVVVEKSLTKQIHSDYVKISIRIEMPVNPPEGYEAAARVAIKRASALIDSEAEKQWEEILS